MVEVPYDYFHDWMNCFRCVKVNDTDMGPILAILNGQFHD